MGRVLLSRLIVVASVTLGACAVQNTDVPPWTGPSGYAQSLTLTATPDSITQDGFSQSAVVITALNVNGQADANRQLQLTVYVDGSPVSFGTLSAYTVFTGSDGKARAQYTAPTSSPFIAGGPGRTVTIYATPIGSNRATAMSQGVTLLVTPPPAKPVELGAPSAFVTFTPAVPKVGDVVSFDASESEATSGRIVTYVWDFGDSKFSEEHGVDASHVYSAAGTYTMVLGVVDDAGRLGSQIHTIFVTN
jgi:PKD repeat protein